MRLIDADALDRMGYVLTRTYQQDEKTMVYETKKLSDVPSAQPERKSGKWINHRNDNGHNIADCDQCGHAIQWFDGDETPLYCCMCGSYNRGEQDG